MLTFFIAVTSSTISRVPCPPSSPLPISYWFHNKLHAIIIIGYFISFVEGKIIIPGSFLGILLDLENTVGSVDGVWFLDTILLLGVAGQAGEAKQSNNQSP